MLADEVDLVIGVDSHRDQHALAVVAAHGGLLSEALVAAAPHGYARALALADESAPGRRAWAIEGSGSYGAGLARFLAARDELVLEVARSKREARRSQRKSDALDAVRAARSVLGANKVARPRADGTREALRALVTTREGAIAARRAALNQLRALIVSCPEPLRGELRALTRARLLARCAGLRRAQRSRAELAGTTLALRACARRIRAASAEERELKGAILALVREWAPELLAEQGVGPISAAQVLISWSHPGRFHCEAAFARHSGAAPVPASSGKVVRYRLDRGGDRQLNRALHTIAVSRRKSDARIHRATHTRGQERARGTPLSQALPRPPSLPTTRGAPPDCLTFIEASPDMRHSATADV
jgi:transposase